MNNTNNQGGADPAGAGMPGEMHGGEGIPNGPEFATKAVRRVRLTNVVLAVVLTVSAGSLYLMRKQGKGAGLTFQVTKIDYDAKETGRITPEQQRVLDDLKRLNETKTAATERIHKNPFQLETQAPPVPTMETDAERRRQAEQERLERERRQQEISNRLAGLELNGVMGGNVVLARISGTTVQVGTRVGEVFTVVAIHPEDRTVELSYEDQRYTLRMAETPGAQPRRAATPIRR
jgi:hypothetical protein